MTDSPTMSGLESLDLGPFDPETVTTIRTAVLILSRRMRYQQVGDELSPSESAVLGRVGREGPVTPGQLAKSEHVQPPSMTRIIERLEGKGLLRRDRHPDDRRQVLISRTSAGDAFVEQSRRVRTAWLLGQLAKLTESDQSALCAAAGALGRLADMQ